MNSGPKLRVGMVVPPLPCPRYEGLDLAVEALSKGLHERGHDVVVWTIADPMRTSQWAVQVGLSANSLHSVMALEGELGSCDIVHDHSLAALFLRNLHHRAPVVTTNYGRFDADPIPMYRRRPDDHVPLCAVSVDQGRRAPKSLRVSTAIHPGLDVGRYRYRRRAGDYLVTTCRLRPDGGVVEAIEVARGADLPLWICAPVESPEEHEFFEDVVRPCLGPNVQLDDLAPTDRIDLMAGAKAMIHPVQDHEPFAMAIVEAMACGTPTVALARGANAEIIDYGRTGYVADTMAGMIAAVRHIDAIDRAACRERAEDFFSCDEVARFHEELYFEILDPAPKSDDANDVGTSNEREPAALPVDGAHF